MGTVPAASIAGMVFSLVVSFGLPILLLILLKVKTKASFSSFVFGAFTFIVFALILEQIFHKIVFSLTGSALTDNIWLYALYGGLAAAFFEETGRFIVLKTLMKNKLDHDNGVMFGAGHGGAEAMIIVGMSYISNIVTSVMINTGAGEEVFSSLGDDALSAISQLWTLPSYQFFLAGVERIFAIFLQIAMAYLVYLAVRYGKIRYYGMAFIIHFAVDALTVIISNATSLVIVELAVAVMTVMAMLIARHFSKVEEQTDAD